jgi:hypothetical protein
MVMSPAALESENDCGGEAQQELQSTVFSSERAPHSTNPQMSDSNKDLVVVVRWMPDTKTNWPTDCQS